MKRLLLFSLLCLLALSVEAIAAPTSTTTTTPMTQREVAKILYGEGASFRGSPTTTVPNGRQYCTADKSMATDAQKQDSFDKMAKAILTRKHCGLSVGDGVGTAKPVDGSNKPGPGAKSSWSMAEKAAKKAEDWWNNLSDNEKKDLCEGGTCYFYHKCYCCEPDGDAPSHCQADSEVEALGEGIEIAQSNRFELMDDFYPCLIDPKAKGCPTTGHVEAASYKKVPCPGCRHFNEPPFWKNMPNAPRSTAGENMNETLSSCWVEVVFMGGGK